ncbi:guanylate cyclase [Mycobacterium sherrisii]|uniref:Guanylate cyclase n=1 Tax=Mycobacterium sherrisii TaxID=243061 RepID=A0A1E3SCA1_9MYCO|nr:guanylate cyclase [Mycobacterium sherrisii]MEC4765600.1 guanylate cyclase [Mycobacterium sherrisii]ODQ99282.1 guanylate cyclase [Mycobacterium sherrisii]
MLTLEQAVHETRTGDLWLFRGGSGPDRAIQTLTNSPVNHVGMTVAIDDLPPLIWHAELGDKLVDLWTGTNHRGVQLNDLHQAVLQWAQRYRQRCWLRQLTPNPGREQENALLQVIARMDGTAFPTTARLTGRWLRGRLPTAYDWLQGIPLVDKKIRESTQRRKQRQRLGLETAYCAETVAITYEEMGLLQTEKYSNYFDPGSFWSGDALPLAPGYALGQEIEVAVG